MIPRFRRPLRALSTGLAALALALAPACVFVHVQGDLGELTGYEGRLVDVAGRAEPTNASFRSDLDSKLEWDAWGVEETMQVEFELAPEELEAYFDDLCAEAEAEAERRGRIVARARRGWTYELEYEGRHEGEMRLEIVEQGAGSSYPYRLEMHWEEDHD